MNDSEVCNFADDNTVFCGHKNLKLALLNLNSDLSNVMDWFKINSLKANPRKFQFMVLGANKNDCFNLNVAGKAIPFSSEVELLGITIDYELKFKKHINELCRKASYKLHALQRIRRYLSVDKARLLTNAFIKRQFNYAPLIWIFAAKTLINKIRKIHHRTLQVVYDDFNKLYDELLELNNDLSIHQRHLRYLASAVFKSIIHLNPQFMLSYFEEKPMPYNLRDGSKLVLPKTKSSRFGIHSLRFRGSLLWNNLPVSVKNCQSLNKFTLELKNLGNIHCTCLVCH